MYYLSLSDLLRVEGFASAFSKNDKKEIDKILFNNGVDVSKGVRENVCNHRSLTGEVVNCLRYEGIERSDRSWRDTGAASLEAWINSETSFTDMKQELREMSKEVCQDKVCK